MHEYMICCTFFELHLAYFIPTDLQNIFWLCPKMTVLMKRVNNSLLFLYLFIVLFFLARLVLLVKGYGQRLHNFKGDI